MGSPLRDPRGKDLLADKKLHECGEMLQKKTVVLYKYVKFGGQTSLEQF